MDNDNMNPVMWACYFDKVENVELLLNITCDDETRFETIDVEIKCCDKKGRCVLHWSVMKSENKDCLKVSKDCLPYKLIMIIKVQLL